MAAMRAIVKFFSDLFVVQPAHMVAANNEADQTIEMVRKITERLKSNG